MHVAPHTRIAALLVLGVAAIAHVARLQPSTVFAIAPGQSARPSAHPLLGKTAPEFEMHLVRRPGLLRRSSDGPLRRPDDWAGKILVVNFWSSWCVACEVEQSELVEFAKKYEDEVQVIGIVDSDTRENVLAYLRRHREVDYPILHGGPSEAAGKYLVRGLPQTFVIDRSGVVRTWFVAAVTAEALSKAVQDLQQ